MKIRRFPLFAAGAIALASAQGARGAEPAIISVARAYLGSDAALDAVTSIHFTGVIDVTDPDDAKQSISHLPIDVIYEKPLRHRTVIRGEKAIQTKVLDGYDAWERLEDPADRTKFRLTWLSSEDTKALRASTWENLYYYRGLSPQDGVVEDKGPATVDGLSCDRVDFIHARTIVFSRYFEMGTGRLVLTETAGEKVREHGQTVVNGIRFATSIVSTSRTPSGKEKAATITFEKIEVNQRFGDDVFAPPNLLPGGAAATAAKK